MKNYLKIFLVFALLFVVSCATVPAPASKNIGAIHGKLTVNLNKMWYQIHAGLHKKDVLVKLENVDTHEIFTTKTVDSHFTFYNLKPGNYTIVRWRVERRLSNNHYTYVYGNVNMPLIIVKAGEVRLVKEIKGFVTVQGRKKVKVKTRFYKKDTKNLKSNFRNNPNHKEWLDFKIM